MFHVKFDNCIRETRTFFSSIFQVSKSNQKNEIVYFFWRMLLSYLHEIFLNYANEKSAMLEWDL